MAAAGPERPSAHGAPALARRVPLAHLPTPLEPLDRLGRHLGLAPGRLWAKRDDLTGLAGGGNKARKLEFLCADALDRGCDTLVTGGGLQSNHVRMTAAAANRLGLGCLVVLAGTRPDVPAGNVVLNELLGADIVWAAQESAAMDYDAVEAAIVAECHRLAAGGRRPYGMPIGGASAVGALGYVTAALELADQTARQAGGLALVVTADGSGGTHAGLAVGLGDHALVLGVDVGARTDLEVEVPAKAVETAALAGLGPPAGTVQLDSRHTGPYYGSLTDDCREALDLAARLEGLVLDPVYTGKAMAGLVAACRRGDVPDGPVVFMHTGGLPALFAEGAPAWVRGGGPLGPRSERAARALSD